MAHPVHSAAAATGGGGSSPSLARAKLCWLSSGSGTGSDAGSTRAAAGAAGAATVAAAEESAAAGAAAATGPAAAAASSPASPPACTPTSPSAGACGLGAGSTVPRSASATAPAAAAAQDESPAHCCAVCARLADPSKSSVPGRLGCGPLVEPALAADSKEAPAGDSVLPSTLIGMRACSKSVRASRRPHCAPLRRRPM